MKRVFSLIAALALLLAPALADETWVCPGCGRTVSAEFPFCPWCRHESVLPLPTAEPEDWLCARCGRWIDAQFPNCPYCGGSREETGLKEGEWFCRYCREVHDGNFCGTHGMSREEAAETPPPKPTSTPEPTPSPEPVPTPGPSPTPEPILVFGSTDMKKARVGDCVRFGSYPQTREGNDKTPIEWIALERDGDTLTLISRYALDCRKYHDTLTYVTWAKCDLRKWLNREFFSAAFTEEEQKAIVTTHLKNRNNATYGTYGGADTDDRVFIPSLEEIKRWYDLPDVSEHDMLYNGIFGVSEELIAVPTAYARAQGAATAYGYTETGKNPCRSWWLRSPGYRTNQAAFVSEKGVVSNPGASVDDPYTAVRPVVVLRIGQ